MRRSHTRMVGMLAAGALALASTAPGGSVFGGTGVGNPGSTQITSPIGGGGPGGPAVGTAPQRSAAT